GRLGDRGGRRARRAARVRRLRAGRHPDPPAAMSDHRGLPVPDGLDGLRADAALARLFGFSRTTAAGLVEAGDALLDGATLAKSGGVGAGAGLEVTLRALPAPPAAAPAPVEGLTVLYADDDLAVVDKPVGVAAHPSPGWDGPTVIGGLAAMGHRVSTSGAAERQGGVHRLDGGTTRGLGGAKGGGADTDLERRVPRPTRGTR